MDGGTPLLLVPLCFIWLEAGCANEVEASRFRIRDFEFSTLLDHVNL